MRRPKAWLAAKCANDVNAGRAEEVFAASVGEFWVCWSASQSPQLAKAVRAQNMLATSAMIVQAR
jgi:hypothetical protein